MQEKIFAFIHKKKASKKVLFIKKIKISGAAAVGRAIESAFKKILAENPQIIIRNGQNKPMKISFLEVNSTAFISGDLICTIFSKTFYNRFIHEFMNEKKMAIDPSFEPAFSPMIRRPVALPRVFA